jgi:hypothetical protein
MSGERQGASGTHRRLGGGKNRTSLDTLERRQVVSAPAENWTMIPRLSRQ